MNDVIQSDHVSPADLSSALRLIAPELASVRLFDLSGLANRAADTIEALQARVAELEGMNPEARGLAAWNKDTTP